MALFVQANKVYDGWVWLSLLLIITDAMQAQYLIVLCTFKEQLQQHVRVHAVEAVMACRDIENTLQALTGNNINNLSPTPHYSTFSAAVFYSF